MFAIIYFGLNNIDRPNFICLPVVRDAMTDWRVKLRLLKNCSCPNNIPNNKHAQEKSSNRLTDHLHRLKVLRNCNKSDKSQVLKAVIDANFPPYLRYECYIRELKKKDSF